MSLKHTLYTKQNYHKQLKNYSCINISDDDQNVYKVSNSDTIDSYVSIKQYLPVTTIYKKCLQVMQHFFYIKMNLK